MLNLSNISTYLSNKSRKKKIDRKVREALKIASLRKRRHNNEHDMIQEHGQYVTTKFWKPIFSFLREKILH